MIQRYGIYWLPRAARKAIMYNSKCPLATWRQDATVDSAWLRSKSLQTSTMHLFALVVAASLAPGALPFCARNGRVCEWTSCGQANGKIGETRDRWRVHQKPVLVRDTLVTWTKELSITELCSSTSERNPNPGRDCCSDYGTGCIVGSSSLFCGEHKYLYI